MNRLRRDIWNRTVIWLERITAGSSTWPDFDGMIKSVFEDSDLVMCLCLCSVRLNQWAGVDSLIEWLICLLIWCVGLIFWMVDCVWGRKMELLIACVCGWLFEWLIVCGVDCEWLIVCGVDCEWLIVCGWLWVVDCLSGWLCVGLIVWVVDCMYNWLKQWIFASEFRVRKSEFITYQLIDGNKNLI